MVEPPPLSGEVDRVAGLAADQAVDSGSLAAPAAAGRSNLWRHADYMKIWLAAATSQMGSQVSQLAIPFIAAYLLRAPTFEVALLGAVEMAPFIIFALPAGAWLDRMRRRPVLIAGDLGRALALITIPIAFALGILTIWQLYVVGFTTGLLTVFFDVADQSYLPALLEPQELMEGNARLQMPASAAQILGPGIGGGLINLIGAPFAIVADAASFVASGGLISLIRKHEPKPERRVGADGRHVGLRREISEGLRYVLGNRYLRMIAGCTGISNLGNSLQFAIFPVFAYVELKLSPGLVGLAFGLGGFGVLAGAVVAGPLGRRFGVGPTVIAAAMLTGPAALALAFLPADHTAAFLVLLGIQLAFGLANVVYNVNQVSFRQAITPLEMQGRMNATMRFIVWGTMPIGAVAGGILATFLPLRTTLVIGALIAGSAFLWVLFSPVRTLREIPTQTRG